MICNHYLGYLGVKLDEEANKKRGEDIAISTADSSTHRWYHRLGGIFPDWRL